MKNVFRIIELEDRQVLLAKAYDDEKDLEQLRIEFYTDFGTMELKMSFNSGEDRDKHFDIYTKEQAQILVQNILK